ncbi:hypothetical protein ACX818_001381 [Acinetobacter baumannii]
MARTIEDVKLEYGIMSYAEMAKGRRVSYYSDRMEAKVPVLKPDQDIYPKDIEAIHAWIDADKDNFWRVQVLKKYHDDTVELTDEQAQWILDQENAQEELNKTVDEFNRLLSKAEQLADEHNLDFDIDPAYGMGGNYRNGEWHPSSQSC